MSSPVRIGPVALETRLAAYPVAQEGRGGPDAQARRDQLLIRGLLLERRRAIEPHRRPAFDARADAILARLDPPATAIAEPALAAPIAELRAA